MKKNKLSSNHQSGVTLLLSILILSSILAISFSLATILFVEVRTSGDLIKTEPAIYAANAISEEALFKIKRQVPSFSYSTQFGNAQATSTESTLTDPVQLVRVPAASNTFYNTSVNFPIYSDPTSASSGYGRIDISYPPQSANTAVDVYVCEFDINNSTPYYSPGAPCTNPAPQNTYWAPTSALGQGVPYPLTSGVTRTINIDYTKQQQLILVNKYGVSDTYVQITTYDQNSVAKGLPYFAQTAVTISASSGGVSRRIKLVTPNPTGSAANSTNWAATANGGVASASSQYSANYPINNITDGDRLGNNWGKGGLNGGWNDASGPPSWVQVDFSGTKSISEIDVYTLANCFGSCASIDSATSASTYGISDFQVQYDNGGTWQTVGSVSGNALAWSKFNFSSVSTGKIRVNITGARAGYSRVVEVEAY